jgi:hypothetical protein
MDIYKTLSRRLFQISGLTNTVRQKQCREKSDDSIAEENESCRPAHIQARARNGLGTSSLQSHSSHIEVFPPEN